MKRLACVLCHLLFSVLILTSFFACLPAFAQDTNNQAVGFPANGSFSGGGIDTVQLNNGNLHVELPLFALPGRGPGVAVKYVYDSKGWYAHTLNIVQDSPVYIDPRTFRNFGANNLPWAISAPLANGSGLSGVVGGGGSCTGHTVSKTTYTYREPNGTSHTFSSVYPTPNPCNFTNPSNMVSATDDSGWSMQIDGGGLPTKVFSKEGANISFQGTFSSQTGWTLQDTNGNQITRAKSGTAPAANLTDSLGRSLNVAPVGPDGFGKYNLTYSDSNGATQTIQITMITVNVHTSLCGVQNTGSQGPCNEYTGSWQAPSEILLPNTQKYTISYVQNSHGELASIQLPTGGSISYTFGTTQPGGKDDGGPRVIARTIQESVSSPTATWTYSYNATDNRQTTVRDPLGNDEVHVFQRLVAVLNSPTYEVTNTVYNGPASNNLILKKIQTGYTGVGVSYLPSSETVTWDPNGANLVSRTESDYETWGNVTEQREYAFGVGNYGALVRKTHFNYAHISGNTNYNVNYKNLNIANRVTQKTVYDSSGTTIVADSKTAYDGNTVSAISGVPNHVTMATQYRGNPTQSQVWRNLPSVSWLPTNNTYNDLGHLISTQDPGGHTTTFNYTDSWYATGCGVGGNTQAFLYETDPPTTQNSQGAIVQHRSRSKYYPCTGQKQLTQDENDIDTGTNRGTSYTYDSMLRPGCIYDSAAGQTCNAYGDAPGSVSVTTTTKIDGSNNRVEVSNHDGLGRVKNTVLQDSVGPYAETDIITDTTYDLLGRVLCVSNPHRWITSQTDGQTCYQYDALSRKTQESPPDSATGGVVTYTYGAQTTGTLGLTTTITDQAGKKRKSVNDALGQLVDVWEPDSTNALMWDTAYQYDTLGDLKRVDQKGGDANSANWRTRTFTYDSLSRLLTATNPESGQITWTYDNDSNVLTKIDAKGTTIAYNYDALHRVATTGSTHAKSYTNNPPPNDAAVDYYFDQTSYNGLAISEGVGKQTGMHDATGDSAWTFDSEGRTVTENQKISITGLTSSAITKSISYTYNLDGSLASMIYPSGRTVNYAYSTIGRTGSVADNGTGGATYLSWSPPAGSCSSQNQNRYSVHGEELCLNHGNGVVSYNGFNNRFQPSLLSAAGASGTVLSLSYTFTDANSKNNGLLWKITNNKDNNRSQNFYYDQLNRILLAYTDGNLWSNRFTIDQWGNLTNKGACISGDLCFGKPQGENFVGTATAKNQLNTYSYDNNGNLLNDQLGHAFTYDAENRPYSGGGVTYYYDGTGERVAKSNGKLYWFQDDNSPVAESDVSGNLTFEFVFANGKRWARRDASGTVHYYFSDQINSSNVITSTDGSTIQSESDFYPYGGERRIVADSTGNNYKFTGKERDSETTNDYFGARFYSSNFGRFLTPDWAATPAAIPYAQMGIPQTLNLYSYLGNNSLTSTDSDGHCCESFALFGPILAPTGFAVELATNPKQALADLAIGAGKGLQNLVNIVQSDHTLSPSQVIPSATPTSSSQAVGMVGFTAVTSGIAPESAVEKTVASSPTAAETAVEVSISRSMSPAAAQHIEEAQAAGQPSVLTLERTGAEARGQQAVKDVPKVSGMDRDEYPPKCCAEGGEGASVKHIPSGDNRSAGAQLGNQVKDLQDGTKVKIVVTDDPIRK